MAVSAWNVAVVSYILVDIDNIIIVTSSTTKHADLSGFVVVPLIR